MISPAAFLFFLKKCNIINIKIIVFYWPTSTVYLINLCFSNSSVNAKKEILRYASPSHVCDFYFLFFVFSFVLEDH